ncbi:MAG: cytochrome c oxidase subunit 3 [Bryobacterales bacterium]
MKSSIESHFSTLRQQAESAEFGMWIFLATEVLFFGAVFCSYAVYRASYPHAWKAGAGLNDAMLATVMTAVLLTSSLTMAMGVQAAKRGNSSPLRRNVLLTMLLGVLFLVLKFYEYYEHAHHQLVPGWDFSGYQGASAQNVELFMSFYFAMTGLHALHMIVGLGLLATIWVMAGRGRFDEAYHAPVENIGLYWHFVDIVWIFLFPLLYLV